MYRQIGRKGAMLFMAPLFAGRLRLEGRNVPVYPMVRD